MYKILDLSKGEYLQTYDIFWEPKDAEYVSKSAAKQAIDEIVFSSSYDSALSNHSVFKRTAKIKAEWLEIIEVTNV